MEVKYIIEIKGRDSFDYEVTSYYNGIYVDDYGYVRIDTTKDPLCAKHFDTVNTEAKCSVVNAIKNAVLKGNTVAVKTIEYTIKNA